MAFPTSGLLDAFNAGANQDLTARSGWGASVIDTTVPDPSSKTDATPTFASSPSPFSQSSNVWTLGAANAEAWATNGNITGGTGFGLWARLQNVGTTTPSGYLAEYLSSTNQLDLFAVVAGVKTLIASGSFFIEAPGDQFGIECIGTTITAYLRVTPGAWGVSCTVTDSSITGAGDIGLSIRDNTQPVDDFGGGAIIPPAVPKPQIHVARRVWAGG